MIVPRAWCLVAWWTALWLGAAGHPHGRARDQLPPAAAKVVQARDSQDEPSCDELRAMWRYSKRRAPEIINEISGYRDPFLYNVWPPASSRSASSRGRGAYGRNGIPSPPDVYGRIVVRPPPTFAREPQLEPPLYGEFPKQSRLRTPGGGPMLRFPGGGKLQPGGPVPQAGQFQRLKELVRTERARELQAQRLAEQRAARAAARRHDLYPRYAGGAPDQLQRIDYPLGDTLDHIRRQHMYDEESRRSPLARARRFGAADARDGVEEYLDALYRDIF